jgi:EAL domain-containing protein (putative c-di-GMP-specific phosphodiesterase class I)
VVFEPRMHAEVMERLDLQGDLQRALGAGEFRLQFQPLLSLDRYRPVGLEALLRWNHPERGPISPSVFIPLAEETGVIVELGRWVLRESCRQVATWRRTEWPDLGLSVNVSGRQLLDGQLVRDVEAVLAETGLPAPSLTLELTETVLMDDPGNILLRLSELKSLGVQLAIDDFGTGYSSLSYLRRFPVDELKIDKSFIDNIGSIDEDLAIVRTVVELARILQLRTTAEGIETQEQLDLLRELGCQVGQGYFFARPLDPADVPGYLARHRIDQIGPNIAPTTTGPVSPALGR